MSKEIIDAGTVIQIDDRFFIDEEYNVYAMGFKIGIIPINRLNWFKQTSKPKPTDIHKVIFIEEGIFSIKELVDIIEEFKLLSLQDQEELLYMTTNKLSEITELESMIELPQVPDVFLYIHNSMYKVEAKHIKQVQLLITKGELDYNKVWLESQDKIINFNEEGELTDNLPGEITQLSLLTSIQWNSIQWLYQHKIAKSKNN